MKNWVSNEVERFQKEIAALETEFASRKQQLFAKLAEMLGVPAAPVKAKPGRPPKSAAAFAPALEPKRRGRPPLATPRPGRKRAGEDTLPTVIVQVLRASAQPLNAKEILAQLQKVGWRTSSHDPQAMVYKTLHRIEKTKMVVKAERGKFTAGK